MKKIIATLIILLFTNISFSQKDIIGLGLSKCTTFYNSTIEEKILYMSWAAGYISSQNSLNNRVHAKDVSYDTSIIWLEYFCHSNPDKLFKDAVKSYINKFTN
tara:strand:+ start:512 stop:820 length:309 start_codon:yes stop_codon:yes gene_type:complete